MKVEPQSAEEQQVSSVGTSTNGGRENDGDELKKENIALKVYF
jgi:hypothetical protein